MRGSEDAWRIAELNAVQMMENSIDVQACYSAPHQLQPLPVRTDAAEAHGLSLEREAATLLKASHVDTQPIDVVHDASVDSFPASDPPAWIGMRLGNPQR
jgi:hypothetical protein